MNPVIVKVTQDFSDGTQTVYEFNENQKAAQIEAEVSEAVADKDMTEEEIMNLPLSEESAEEAESTPADGEEVLEQTVE